MKRGFVILREAAVSAWSQPVTSIVTLLLVSAMCLAVVLTAGRAEGAQRVVLKTIDSANSRSIVVRATAGAGITPHVVERLSHVSGIEWAGAFGAARDVYNSSVGDSGRVALRTFYSATGTESQLPNPSFISDAVWATPQALKRLGFAEPVGGVTRVDDQKPYNLVGEYSAPAYLHLIEPSLLASETVNARTANDDITLIVVVARSSADVKPMTSFVRSVLGVSDMSRVTISTSAQLAAVRDTVGSDLASFSRALVISVFGVTAVLVAVVAYALVLFRRRDFGRRRALGASKSFIVALLVTQIGFLSLAGSLIGVLGASLYLGLSGAPVPSFSFLLSTGVLSCSAGVLASIAPALGAARRDPIAELRTP